MATFTVCLQQYVERVAVVEVEAEDAQEAIAIAKLHGSSAVWKDGDDAYEVGAYAVHDARDNTVWERE